MINFTSNKQNNRITQIWDKTKDSFLQECVHHPRDYMKAKPLRDLMNEDHIVNSAIWVLVYRMVHDSN